MRNYFSIKLRSNFRRIIYHSLIHYLLGIFMTTFLTTSVFIFQTSFWLNSIFIPKLLSVYLPIERIYGGFDVVYLYEGRLKSNVPKV